MYVLLVYIIGECAEPKQKAQTCKMAAKRTEAAFASPRAF